MTTLGLCLWYGV